MFLLHDETTNHSTASATGDEESMQSFALYGSLSGKTSESILPVQPRTKPLIHGTAVRESGTVQRRMGD